MDKKTYEMLFDKSIKEEYRKKYLIEEYHEYEKERYYKRKRILSNNIKRIDVIEDKNEIDINNKIIHEAIKTLTKKQQEIIKLIYFERKSQVEVAHKLKVSKQTINNSLVRIHKKLRKLLKK